jgi:hypothetical protein
LYFLCVADKVNIILAMGLPKVGISPKHSRPFHGRALPHVADTKAGFLRSMKWREFRKHQVIVEKSFGDEKSCVGGTTDVSWREEPKV